MPVASTPAVKHLLLGDGSVRFIQISITEQIWWALMTSQDGFIISSDQY